MYICMYTDIYMWTMGNSWIRNFYYMFIAKICMDYYGYLPFCHTPKAEST